MPEGAIENIDFTNTEQYTLSIRLSTDGFSFLYIIRFRKENLSYQNGLLKHRFH